MIFSSEDKLCIMEALLSIYRCKIRVFLRFRSKKIFLYLTLDVSCKLSSMHNLEPAWYYFVYFEIPSVKMRSGIKYSLAFSIIVVIFSAHTIIQE